MADRRYNLLTITLDQLRYDSVGFGGPNAVCGRVHTPNLDRLAARSLWFDNAYTSIPTCCPARQSMLVGRRAETFGALWNFGITSQISSLQPGQLPTWPEALRDAGYNMAYVGEWDVSPTYTPLDFGYAVYRPLQEYTAWRAEHYPDCNPAFSWTGSTDPIPVEASRTHVLADWAIEHIRQFAREDRPWHVRLDLAEPHPPCMPCAPFADMYDAAAMQPWPGFNDTFANKPYIQRQSLYSWGNETRNWAYWSQYAAHYFAVVSQTDDAIGRVLAALEAAGAADNTVILFTADHGDMAGNHRMMDKHYILYDDVTHVPMILYAPGVTPRRITGFVNNCLDMAPTLLALAGLPCFDCDGHSLAELVGGEGEPGTRAEAVSTYNGQQCGLYSQRMLRTKDWKYIWNLTDTDELYNMNADPWELDNRIHDPALADLVTDMRRRLYTLLQKEDPDIVKTEWMHRQLWEGRKL